ncbi:MAG: GNAT family N-acetyltransferase [Actinomycetota bacterium]|nr:GNAT family N-acetyltransferase [Actinomycetota bacterium]
MAGPPQRDAAPGARQGVVIETPRLLVRVPADDDAPVYYEIHGDPDVMRWLGGAQPKSVDDERERIAARRAMHDELGFTLWTVAEKDSGDVVGLAGLFPVENEGPEVEVAYHFRKDRWGRGYATEVARACVHYGFAEAGLQSIVGLVAPENVASARVLEKCGLTREGRAHYYGMDLLKYVTRAPG